MFARAGLVGVAVVVGFGCEATEPEPVVTLDYETTSWRVTDSVVTDAVAAGASLALVLREGGQVNGSLVLPASINNGVDLFADMAGVWFKRGDTIRFNQVSQTFVGDVDWLLSLQHLTMADSVGDRLFEVELTRVFR